MNELASLPQIQHSVTLIGRRWFQRGPGNTYHTVEIMVDGRTVHKSGIHYGYGSQYEQTAMDWLCKQGYIRGEESHSPPWQVFREDRKLAYSSQAFDVPRKKDL